MKINNRVTDSLQNHGVAKPLGLFPSRSKISPSPVGFGQLITCQVDLLTQPMNDKRQQKRKYCLASRLFSSPKHFWSFAFLLLLYIFVSLYLNKFYSGVAKTIDSLYVPYEFFFCDNFVYFKLKPLKIVQLHI